MKVKVDVNVEQFVKRINEVKKESGRSSEEMLNYTMILMLQAGRSATKLGRKNRSLVTQDAEAEPDADFRDHVSDDGPVASQPKRRFFRLFKQGSYIPRKIFVPIIPRKTKNNAAERESAISARDSIVSKFKKIRFRGVARASWGWAMKMVSSKARMIGSANEVETPRSKLIEVVRQMTGIFPSIEVTNKLGWIRRIAPGIEQRMMNSADARLQKNLERILQARIDKAERAVA